MFIKIESLTPQTWIRSILLTNIREQYLFLIVVGYSRTNHGYRLPNSNCGEALHKHSQIVALKNMG